MKFKKPTSIKSLFLQTGKLLGVVFLTGTFISPSVAFAFFDVSVAAQANTLSAGTLSYTLSTSLLSARITPEAASSVSFMTSSTGNIPPQYRLSAQKGTCADAFYNGLGVTVTQGTPVYAGTLSALVATSSQSGTWQISINAGQAIASVDETCQVQLHLDAWQPQFASSTMGGFTESNTLTLQLTAGEYLGRTIVLNEILPNPEGDDTQHGLKGEWVEVYNLATTTQSLSGWYVEDAAHHRVPFTASTTMNGRMTIGSPSSGLEWVVLYMNGAILNNEGDTVSLYDNHGLLRDRYTYGKSETDRNSDSDNTQGEANSGPHGIETPSQEGKSFARIPDGTGAWVDPRPTPGEPNTDAPFVPFSLPLMVTSDHHVSSLSTTTPALVVATSSSPDVASTTPIDTPLPIETPPATTTTAVTDIKPSDPITAQAPLTLPLILTQTKLPLTPPARSTIETPVDTAIPSVSPKKDSASTTPPTS